jgi:hypothetical protein
LADDVVTAEAVGVVESINGNDFTIVFDGEITLSGLTDGEVYFLSDSVAGTLTTTEPTTIGTISKPILVAYSTTKGIVKSYRGVLLTPEVLITGPTGPIDIAWLLAMATLG